MSSDNGYISDYLIHWTGKHGEEQGAKVLSTIASTCELLLSHNPIHRFDCFREIHEKMVCFTDVPLAHSEHHCQRYGRFGVAFQKLKLMNVGAQPVFYVSHAYKKDMDMIFKFLQGQTGNTTIDPAVFRALHHHFYFMQRFSDKRADRHDTFYYEREWRLGSQSLPTPNELNRPNPKYHCQQEGYPTCMGRRVIHNDQEYFAFDPQDVAFLVAPQVWLSRIKNPKGFQLSAFEDLAMENSVGN